MLEQPLPDELKDLYVKATLSQRYQLAKGRIEGPDSEADRLVNSVAAVEGFARAAAVQAAVRRGETVLTAYRRLRLFDPVAIIKNDVCTMYKTTPEKAFDRGDWEQLPKAFEYRNLLVHEATLLPSETCKTLATAAQNVFERLAEMAGVNAKQVR